VLRLAWTLTRGHRFTPWRSPYLRWRIETYSGIHADRINFRIFWKFMWRHRADLMRYLRWAQMEERAAHHKKTSPAMRCLAQMAILGSTVLLSAGLMPAQESKHLPVYSAQDKILYGKVKVEDGSALPSLAAIESVCGGAAFPLGFADAGGNFRVVLSSGGPRFNSITPANDFSFLADCHLRAQLPGYRSQHIPPTLMREIGANSTISAGTILLSRLKTAKPQQADGVVSKAALNAYKRGAEAMSSGRWKPAKSEFEKAVALEPAYFAAWIGIGAADEALEQWSEAEAAYRKAIQANPTTPDPYLRLARLGARTDNWNLAAEYSEAAVGLNPQELCEGFSLCALANAKLGRMDVAESSAAAGLRIDTANDYPMMWLIAALADANRKRYADATKKMERFLALVPKAEAIKEVRQELAELRSRLANK
jgi:tetratricopeptide (TPR) repeat protein